MPRRDLMNPGDFEQQMDELFDRVIDKIERTHNRIHEVAERGGKVISVIGPQDCSVGEIIDVQDPDGNDHKAKVLAVVPITGFDPETKERVYFAEIAAELLDADQTRDSFESLYGGPEDDEETESGTEGGEVQEASEVSGQEGADGGLPAVSDSVGEEPAPEGELGPYSFGEAGERDDGECAGCDANADMCRRNQAMFGVHAGSPRENLDPSG